MPRRLRIVLAAAALTALMQYSHTQAAHAEPTTSPSPVASPSRGCLVFEDDSFICGTWRLTTSDDWEVDDSTPFVSGCIPGGLCDEPTPFTDDCPPSLEDVECWNATHDDY